VDTNTRGVSLTTASTAQGRYDSDMMIILSPHFETNWGTKLGTNWGTHLGTNSGKMDDFHRKMDDLNMVLILCQDYTRRVC
jgi:hypothetical protein